MSIDGIFWLLIGILLGLLLFPLVLIGAIVLGLFLILASPIAFPSMLIVGIALVVIGLLGLILKL